MAESLLLSIKDPRWLSFIEQDPAAMIFHHPAWVKLLSDCYGYRPLIFTIIERDGQVCAGIPLAEVNDHLTPHRYVALPFSDYCSPLSQDEEARIHLANTLVEQQQAKRFTRVEIRSPLPIQTNIEPLSPYFLHTVHLSPDIKDVAKQASRQQMQNVRAAEKNGIRIVRSTGLAEARIFYHLHSISRRKHGVPVQPWKFFQLLTENLLDKGLGFILLAYKEDICISAGLFLFWQKTLTYKYSATDEAHQNLRPNHLITWTAMQWGCENGFETFDFGRADIEDEGLRAYKCRWGAKEVPLSYSYIPTAPKMASSDSGRFNKLSKVIIRRSPVWVSQIIGKMFYRFVG